MLLATLCVPVLYACFGTHLLCFCVCLTLMEEEGTITVMDQQIQFNPKAQSDYSSSTNSKTSGGVLKVPCGGFDT